jgi:hypothetical protein
MSADAYIGLVEVYIRTTDFETALEYAKKGYEATGDERLKEKIDMIESGNIFAENGWQMKTSYYKSENELSYYVTFNYNLKGKVATATAYAPDNSIIDKVDYEYDEDGKMTWGVGAYASEFYGDSSPLYRVENKFDDNGQIIGRNEYNDKGNLTSSSEYEYRDDGHVIRTVHRQNGDYEVIEENSDYQIILDEYYDENGNLTNYSTYEYDSNGKILFR